ncbi:hypothetical protein [Rubritalea sp.]
MKGDSTFLCRNAYSVDICYDSISQGVVFDSTVGLGEQIPTGKQGN